VYFHRHELEPFIAEAERTLTLNPNNATLLFELGYLMGTSGHWEWHMELVKKAMILNPYHTDLSYIPHP
jgi:uncharacterized protein HemY